MEVIYHCIKIQSLFSTLQNSQPLHVNALTCSAALITSTVIFHIIQRAIHNNTYKINQNADSSSYKTISNIDREIPLLNKSSSPIKFP